MLSSFLLHLLDVFTLGTYAHENDPKRENETCNVLPHNENKKAGKIHIEIIFVTLDNYVDIFNPLSTPTSDFYFIF